ncbi:hypothetical protein M8C21_028309, partial [Ambrosia artemisiifolia]
MSSILASNGMVLATAMAAVSGTVILLALHLHKQPSTVHHLRPCISSVGKKRKKKNKKVHFAEDVMEPSGNGEEFRRRLQSRNFSPNRSFSTTLKNEECKKTMRRDHKGIPANRMALYSGILRDRGVH